MKIYSKISKKKFKTILWISVAVILCIVAYLAADRFLIEHVEIDLSEDSAASQELADGQTQMDQVEDEAALSGSDASENSAEAYTATDNSYISESKNISITKVVTGSGEEQIVYFVADITFSDATELESAFAKNKYGTNITEIPSQLAEENKAIFAVNGDYYGFRDDGIIIRNGVLYRNVPAREGLCIYLDGSMEVYDETQTNGEQLLEDGAWITLSFGPALLENGNTVSGIEDAEVDTNFGNHSIQGNQPRTGIGIINDNHIIFVFVDGRSEGYSKGMTLDEFAQLFEDLGCETAYNLDGGGSSAMYFMGNLVNNPLGKEQERATSDILFIA